MGYSNFFDLKGFWIFLVLCFCFSLFSSFVFASVFCEIKTDDSHACDGTGPKGGPIVVVYKSVPAGNCSPEFSCADVCAVTTEPPRPSLCHCRTVEVTRFELNPNCCSVKEFDSCRCEAIVVMPLTCPDGSLSNSCDQGQAKNYCAGKFVQPMRLKSSGLLAPISGSGLTGLLLNGRR